MSELERKNGPSAVAETVTKDGRRIGTEVLFSAKDITKTFGGTQALKGVELEIHPGEIVGLVGENGAGKSTLLKIIIGAQPQTSGTMSFHGAPYEPKTPTGRQQGGRGHGLSGAVPDCYPERGPEHFLAMKRTSGRPASSTGPR